MARLGMIRSAMAAALLCASGVPALATTFDFTFSDAADGVSATGTLIATDNNNGSFTATSGSGTLTSTAPGITGGAMTLQPNPLAPESSYTPNGLTYDDQLYPGASPLLGNGIFYQLTSDSTEVVMYENGGGAYGINIGSDFEGAGEFSLTEQVPEPATFSLLGLGVLGLGLARRRRNGSAGL